MKGGIADNTERYALPTQRKIPTGQNPCVRQSNLIPISRNPIPLEIACILVLPA